MFNLGKLFVSFQADTGGFNRAVTETEARTKSAGGRLAGSIAGVGTAATGAGLAVAAMGGKMLVALGVFGLAYKVAAFFATGIKGAMDLGETMSKVGEVFGASTEKVTNQADTMAKRFGLNKNTLLGAAADIGLIAKASGLSKEQAAGLANEMARLAADSTSFSNVPFDVSLEKLRAGLVGEAEPLRAFGVLLSEAAVAEEAVALKLAKSTKALTEQAKVMARASLIRKGLGDATGDLERTENSASNQFRKLGGGMENFATSIGQTMMPALTSAAQALNELAATVIETFEANKSSIEGFGKFVAESFEVLGTLVRNGGKVWEIVQVQVGGMAENLVARFQALGTNIVALGGWVRDNWSKLVTDGIAASGTMIQNFASNLKNLAGAIFKWMFEGDDFEFDWTPLTEGFEATASALPDMVTPHLVDVQAQIDDLAAGITNEAVKHAEKATAAAKSMKKETATAKAAKDEFKSDTLDFAAFASKTRAAQLGKVDDTAKAQVKALNDNKEAVAKNTEALGRTTTAAFA